MNSRHGARSRYGPRCACYYVYGLLKTIQNVKRIGRSCSCARGWRHCPGYSRWGGTWGRLCRKAHPKSWTWARGPGCLSWHWRPISKSWGASSPTNKPTSETFQFKSVSDVTKTGTDAWDLHNFSSFIHSFSSRSFIRTLSFDLHSFVIFLFKFSWTSTDIDGALASIVLLISISTWHCCVNWMTFQLFNKSRLKQLFVRTSIFFKEKSTTCWVVAGFISFKNVSTDTYSVKYRYKYYSWKQNRH